MAWMVLTLASALLGRWLWLERRQLTDGSFGGWLLVEVAMLSLWIALSPNAVIWQKIIAVLMMPVGIFWLLLLAAGMYLWHRHQRKAAAGVAICWLLYAIAGNGTLSGKLFVWLEKDYTHIQPLQAKPFEAVLVLGGSTSMNQHGVAYITGAGDRVLLAARMYHQRQTPLLVTSGSNLPGTHAVNLADQTAQIWRSLGIPNRAIIRVSGPYNTSKEVQAYKRLLQQKGWRRVGLITSAWHLRRTMRLCRKFGLHVYPLPSDHRGGYRSGSPLYLLPTGGGFESIHVALWEILGAFVGR